MPTFASTDLTNTFMVGFLDMVDTYYLPLLGIFAIGIVIGVFISIMAKMSKNGMW